MNESIDMRLSFSAREIDEFFFLFILREWNTIFFSSWLVGTVCDVCLFEHLCGYLRPANDQQQQQGQWIHNE